MYKKQKTFTVLDLPTAERPRERFAEGHAVSAQELIAIVLGRGGPGLSVMTIARNVLIKFKSLEGVVSATVEQLQTVPGLGPAKSLQLKACLEIARQVAHAQIDAAASHQKKKPVASPEDIFQLVQAKIGNPHKEHLVVISFDNRNRALSVDVVAVGTLNTNLVHPREVFAVAISHHAASIAVAHNHPSGDPQPSHADLVVTKRLVQAGKIMGIELLDHVITTTAHCYSFRENKLME